MTMQDMLTKKVPARYLLRGDLVGSGETVVGVGAGARTPSGKVEVILEKAGRQRFAVWGASTLINVRRAAPEIPVYPSRWPALQFDCEGRN